MNTTDIQLIKPEADKLAALIRRFCADSHRESPLRRH